MEAKKEEEKHPLAKEEILHLRKQHFW